MGNAAGNPQPQAVTLLLSGQAKVRFKDLLQTLLGHPWPLIVNGEHKRLLIVIDPQVGVFAVLERVVDQARPCSVTRPFPWGCK